MDSLLTEQETVELYGSLRRVLESIPAQKIRIVAGAAGFDLGLIPDGIVDYQTGFSRKPPILSGIDGQFGQWEAERRAAMIPRLAEELVLFLKGRGEDGSEVVNRAILKNGYRFENGGLVPVNAAGEIPK